MSNKLQKYVGGVSENPGYSLNTPLFARFPSALNSLFDDFFDEVWSEPAIMFQRNWRPTEIEEEKDHYTINVELPGFRKNEISVSTQNNSIKITAKNNKSSFVRSFAIGDWQVDKADVKLENGILSVQIPKSDKQKEKVIDIKEVKEIENK